MNTVLIVVSLFIAGNFSRIYYQNSQVPILGVYEGKLAGISKKPNNVSSQTEIKEKFVQPLPMKETVEKTVKAIESSIAIYGGGELKEKTEHYLYWVFTTRLMKYRDDVEFYIDTDSKLVHYRSSSRAGYSDMGLNRKRYNELASLYANY